MSFVRWKDFIFTRFVPISLGLFSVHCTADADRDNPFDPNSPLFHDVGTISGTVTTKTPPFQTLSGANVQLLPLNKSTITDGSGIFAFRETPPGNYTIVAQSNGFATDSVGVVLETNSSSTVHLPLDALPLFISRNTISVHISQWWPPDDLYAVIFSAEVSDPDGLSDITSVTYEISSFAVSDTLVEQSEAGKYELFVDESELPTGNIHEMVGYLVIYEATDVSGNRSRSEPSTVARVIDDTPVTLQPQELDSVSPFPTLQWELASLPFSFTYSVEVYRIIVGFSTLVWSQSNIPSGTNSVTVTDSLSVGDHFWTVAIVDGFGNLSRSKEASFRVSG